MDIFGDFFGTNPATPEEREAAIDEHLRAAKFDHVVQDGKVYLSVDEMVQTFTRTGALIKLRGVLLNDSRSLHLAGGLEVAATVLRDSGSELLRRHADAILNGDN